MTCFVDDESVNITITKCLININDMVHTFHCYFYSLGSALDEVTDDHTRNPPLVPPDRERKATINETFFAWSILAT